MKLYPTAAHLYIEKSGRITTAQSRKSYLNRLSQLQNQYPHHHVDDFTTNELTAFCLRGDDPAPATIKSRRNTCRSFFEWAHWQKMCHVNPASDLKFTVRPGNGRRRQNNWLDDADVNGLYAALSGDGPVEARDRLLLMLFLSTGLRISELSTLRWDMFDPELTTLRIIGKGKKPDELPIPQQLRDLLNVWRQGAPEDAVAVLPRFRWVTSGSEWGKRELTVHWNRPLSVEGVRSRLKRLARLAGVSFRPHDLRRSFAGKLRKMGLDLKQIQALMRHESSATTDLYLADDPALKAESIKGFRWSVSEAAG